MTDDTGFQQARAGESALPFDPGALTPDAGIVFIGRICSPWTGRAACPKNMAAARATGQPASVALDPRYRDGLLGLERFSHVAVLTWLDRARRDLVIQQPRHATEPRGVFSLRSPVRPNPIGLHVAKITAIDMEAAIVTLEAIDVLDGTPVIDLKPYFASTDAVPEAVGGNRS